MATMKNQQTDGLNTVLEYLTSVPAWYLATSVDGQPHVRPFSFAQIQDGKLWMLQTRNGKRTGAAMVKMAVDMLKQGMIDEKTALLRQEPAKLDELLHPVFNKEALKKAHVITKGLPASPGAACGRVVFFADEAEEWKNRGEKVVLVRQETSPEDLR